MASVTPTVGVVRIIPMTIEGDDSSECSSVDQQAPIMTEETLVSAEKENRIGQCVDSDVSIPVITKSDAKDVLEVLPGQCAHGLTESRQPPNVVDVIEDINHIGTTQVSSDVSKVSGHHLKHIMWKNIKIPIVTQNENGPCPLIAITNVLLLRGRIKLPLQIQSITAEQLMEYIADSILDNVPKNLPETKLLNYEQNMHDAIAVLPRLLTGLDVNVKFTGVQDFEYTPECIIFDLLNIPLYHCWLVDPQALDVVAAIGSLGYNQLVDKIIVNKCSDQPDLVTEALIAEQFLESTASQMTYHGLCELNAAMNHDELAVLFRNNHFSTILKKGIIVNVDKPSAESSQAPQNIPNELFQLVTDQGFLRESRVVWETITNIEGDCMFVDSQFKTVPPRTTSSFVAVSSDVTQEQQISQDFLVALSLQEDQKKQSDKEQAWEEFKQTLPNSNNIMSDAELARSLQEAEQRRVSGSTAAGDSSPSRHTSQTSSPERKKSSGCLIL